MPDLTSRKERHFFLSSVLLAILSCTMLYAVQAFALPEDRDQPIYISSNSFVRDEKQKVAIYEGEVTLDQGSLKIRGDKVTVHLNPDDSPKRIEATGNPAIFRQKPSADDAEVVAEALHLDYQIDKQTIDLYKQASILQEGSTTRSNKITYSMKSARLEAGGEDEGRVNIVIQPRSQSQP